MSKKFQASFTKGTGLDAGQFSITISNPSNSINATNLGNLKDALDAAYSDTFVLKSAKYIETSETYVYPVA